MALPKQILFIQEDYIKAYSHIDGSVDSKDMLPSIIMAQDKNLQPILGTDLFNKLKDDIESDSITGNYKTLLEEHVMMTTLKWFLVEFYPYLQAQIMNGLIGSKSVENVTSLTQSEVGKMIDIERNNAQFYTERLIAYLQNNTSLFPEYSTNSGADMSPESQTYSENGLTISGSNRRNIKNWNC